MASSRQHAAPPAPERAPVPEPTLAERGRTLIKLGRIGTLSTQSRKQPGFPFGSVMPYGPDEQGRPVFLISSMAMHTQNLTADARADVYKRQALGYPSRIEIVKTTGDKITDVPLSLIHI